MTLRRFLQIAMVSSLVLPGCSNKPERVYPPSVDSGAAGQAAMARYDADNDGSLNQEELANCPGIVASLARYDTDESGAVDAAEVTARLDMWRKSRVAMTPAVCQVRLNGEPFAGALVKIIPESFMGDEVKPASGTTDENGYVSLALAEQDRPANAKSAIGVHLGVYKVEITHPDRNLPARFNTASQLGFEASPDAPRGGHVFDLTSR